MIVEVKKKKKKSQLIHMKAIYLIKREKVSNFFPKFLKNIISTT